MADESKKRIPRWALNLVLLALLVGAVVEGAQFAQRREPSRLFFAAIFAAGAALAAVEVRQSEE